MEKSWAREWGERDERVGCKEWSRMKGSEVKGQVQESKIVEFSEMDERVM